MGIIVDAVFFGVVPDGVGIIGAVLILACVFLSAARIVVENKVKTSKIWKVFLFLFCLEEADNGVS